MAVAETFEPTIQTIKGVPVSADEYISMGHRRDAELIRAKGGDNVTAVGDVRSLIHHHLGGKQLFLENSQDSGLKV